MQVGQLVHDLQYQQPGLLPLQYEAGEEFLLIVGDVVEQPLGFFVQQGLPTRFGGLFGADPGQYGIGPLGEGLGVLEGAYAPVNLDECVLHRVLGGVGVVGQADEGKAPHGAVHGLIQPGKCLLVPVLELGAKGAECFIVHLHSVSPLCKGLHSIGQEEMAALGVYHGVKAQQEAIRLLCGSCPCCPQSPLPSAYRNRSAALPAPSRRTRW